MGLGLSMADGNITVEVSTQAAQAELERLRAENAALKHDLQYARDGLIRGRTRMREDNERLRAALAELLACHTESAGWSMSMLTDRAEFDAMLARSQERLHAAIGAAREALGPNTEVRGASRLHGEASSAKGATSTAGLGHHGKDIGEM